MTDTPDTLVERLRAMYELSTCLEAADRIEELERAPMALAQRERAAKLIDDNIILYGGAERWALKPRLDGNTDGLHYAAAIRAQPPLDVAGMVEECAMRIGAFEHAHPVGWAREIWDTLENHARDRYRKFARAALGIPAQRGGGDERH